MKVRVALSPMVESESESILVPMVESESDSSISTNERCEFFSYDVFQTRSVFLWVFYLRELLKKSYEVFLSIQMKKIVSLKH